MQSTSDRSAIADASSRYYPSPKDLIFLAVVACLVAVAAWLAPASVYPVSWTASGTTRVALLRPWSTLAWWIASTLTAVAALTALWVSRGWSFSTLKRSLAPLTLLALWVVPYAPWLPDQWPLLLLLAGPLKFIVLAGALVGCVANLIAPHAPRGPRVSTRTLVIGLSLVVFVGGAVYRAWTQEPGGDEPHYLLITQSLLADGDLKIENNYRQRDYLAFTQLALTPHFLKRGVDGEIYSIHAPGTPVLLLPAYALAGYRGAVMFIGLLAALAAIAIFAAAETVGGATAAFLTWAAMCLTVPFLPMSSMIYSEVPATLVMACVVLWLVRSDPQSAWSWVWRGLLVAALPWLHTKYASLLVGVVLLLLLRLRRQPWHALAMLVPVTVSAACWLMFFYVIYGTPDPTVTYGGSAAAGLLWGNVPRGVLGLLFDQEFGIALYSPILAFAVAGWWAMLREGEHRWLAVMLSFISGLFIVGALRVYMWWGGWSPPARFFLPLVPLLAPMVAIAFARWRGVASRSALAGALLWSLIVSVLLLARPAELLFNERDGVGKLAAKLAAGMPLPAIMPSFLDEDWIGPLRFVGIWVAAAVVAILVVHACVARAHRRMSVFWATATGCVVFGSVVAVLARPLTSASVRAETAQAARMALLDEYDAIRFRALRLDTGQPVDGSGLADVGAITVPVRPSSWSEEGIGPYRLPPGRYDLRVSFARSESPAGDLVVGFKDANRGYVFHREGPMASPARATLEIPAEMPALWIRASSQDMQNAVRWIEFAPRQIVSRSARVDLGQVRAVESVIGGPEGVYVFYVDDDTFPEGGRFWTRGGRPGRVQIAPGGARRLTLTLHMGAPDSEVRVTVGGEVQRLTLRPREEWRTLTFPVAPGTQLLPIEVYTAGGVTPHEIDSRSGDTRFLGCYVIVGAS